MIIDVVATRFACDQCAQSIDTTALTWAECRLDAIARGWHIAIFHGEYLCFCPACREQRTPPPGSRWADQREGRRLTDQDAETRSIAKEKTRTDACVRYAGEIADLRRQLAETQDRLARIGLLLADSATMNEDNAQRLRRQVADAERSAKIQDALQEGLIDSLQINIADLRRQLVEARDELAEANNAALRREIDNAQEIAKLMLMLDAERGVANEICRQLDAVPVEAIRDLYDAWTYASVVEVFPAVRAWLASLE